MSRRHITFPCEGATLFGTIDEADGSTGLLLVSGGNEIRSGAWSGQAELAARIAGAGFPVLRFDRRGVGDSDGPNGGFRSSAPDIAAGLAALRRECPRLTRIVGFGNCDAAAALMLAKGAGLDALILSNPWTIEDESAPLPEAVRSHYGRRLRDPRAIKRLLTGKIAFPRLIGSVLRAMRPAPPPTTLAQEVATGLAGFAGPAALLLAERDRTARVFLAGWSKDDPRIAHCPHATHAFVEPHAREWLADQVLAMLRA